MSDSEEDDLPDFAIENVYDTTIATITQINVDKEISENIARRERRQQILEEKFEFELKLPELPNIPPVPEPTILSIPPSREIFNPNRSLISFNHDTLTTQKFSPSKYKTCTSENVEEFFSWVGSKYKSSSAEDKRQFLQYMWLVISCHPDPYVIKRCHDMLLENNSSWRLKYEEVILIFYNWGVSLTDFVTDIQLDSIASLLNPRLIVSVDNVENVSALREVGHPYCFISVNYVVKVLQILNCQLMICDLEGDKIFRKTVFLLLVLLSLDKKYYQCLSDIHNCLEQLAVYAKSESFCWIETYCEGLFQVESHHAYLSFLADCVVPESMRWCLCVAHCQQALSLEQTFVAYPEPTLLLNLLVDNTEKFLKFDSWALYSFVSIVDAAVKQAISCETDYDVKRGFVDWLNQYMERKIERRTNDVDIDASLISELVSRLQAEWGEYITVEEIRDGEMDVDQDQEL